MKFSVIPEKSFHTLGWNCCIDARVNWKLKFALVKVSCVLFLLLEALFLGTAQPATLILFGGTGSYYWVCPWYKSLSSYALILTRVISKNILDGSWLMLIFYSLILFS